MELYLSIEVISESVSTDRRLDIFTRVVMNLLRCEFQEMLLMRIGNSKLYKLGRLSAESIDDKSE